MFGNELCNHTVLIVPGIDGSGPEHWQTRWEAAHPSFSRVQQRDWHNPVFEEWLQPLESALAAAGPGAAVAAHSLGCLLVARLLTEKPVGIAGALLVAVPDPAAPTFPPQTQGFEFVPTVGLPCRSTVIASTNDPFAEIDFAAQCADAWGSRFVNLGSVGHINALSGLGDWPEGQRLLLELLAT